MELRERIQENFNRGFFGKSMYIDELPPEYPGWTMKFADWFGVGIPVEEYYPFSEYFNSINIRTEHHVQIDDRTYDLLMLICDDQSVRNEFAILCSDFVDPGIDGKFRRKLIKNPEEWWKKWKLLLGNRDTKDSVYPVLAELMMVSKMLESGETPSWTGAENGTHDIETSEYSVEVKSTTARYGYDVTINSIYQLYHQQDKPLYLVFTRMEKSHLGESINDVVKRLINNGYPEDELENTLKKRGLESGRTARNEKYKVIEWRKYCVDESFPAVTEKSFKNDTMPDKIKRIGYTVDLKDLGGESLL